jgi:hypothetical protein
MASRSTWHQWFIPKQPGFRLVVDGLAGVGLKPAPRAEGGFLSAPVIKVRLGIRAGQVCGPCLYKDGYWKDDPKAGVQECRKSANSKNKRDYSNNKCYDY